MNCGGAGAAGAQAACGCLQLQGLMQRPALLVQEGTRRA